jgi:aspartate/methionine/tyrosine aminotransferase
MFSRRTGWDQTTNRYTEAVTHHRKSGRELLDLSASNPTTIGLSFSEAALLSALASPQSLSYEPLARGLPVARGAVAAYYAQKGIAISPDSFILTTSTSEAYSFVFRLLCDAGDAVLVPAPSYPLFDFLADLNDVQLIPYELVYDHGWQIDFASLEAGIRRSAAAGGRCRALLVVQPNNPTGSYVKAHEALELARICVANGLAIIADEVFLDYTFSGAPPYSFASSCDALTFTLSGLSKISALPQMKVAWIVTGGPEALKSEALARLEVIADTYLSMNAPSQWAVPRMLEERLSIQPQLLERILSNLRILDSHLAVHRSCERLAIEGGWYAVLRVPALGSDESLAVMLLEQTGVLVQPGHFYNFAGDGYLVVSLITPRREFEEGIRRALTLISAL